MGGGVSSGFKIVQICIFGVSTGGGENSHLSSLRNAWGECIGVDGGVFSPSSKNSSCLSGDGSLGIKDHSPLKTLSYCFHCPIPFYFINCPCCIHCTVVNPSSGVPYKKDPGRAPMLYTSGPIFSQGRIVAIL